MGSGASKEPSRPTTVASQDASASSRPSTSSMGVQPSMNGRTNSTMSRSQTPPSARPPTKSKAEVFNEKDYKHVLDHVNKAPQRLLTGTFRELVQYLTGPDWPEIGKVRAIFLWLTSIDVYNLKMEEDPPKQSPMEYFSKIQKNQGNHAHLFSGLCQMANIPCMIISGMNKSAAYEIGKKVDRKSMGAQWNAVFIDDSWRFVDAFWASACVVGRKSGEWALVDSDGKVDDEEEDAAETEGTTEHRINEFYFLPDPDKLIWTHYPDEKQWQLLAKPVSVKEFEDHFYVRERFHILDMKTSSTSQMKCTISTKDGEINIPFQLPQEQSEHFRFKYMLYKSRTQMETESKIDAFLDRFVFFEHGKDLVDFSLRFPVKGRFKMDVYGLDVRESDIFDLVCTYLIQCPTEKKNCLPLPDCPPLGWGPVGITKKAGLSPSTHDRALIETKDGKVTVRFKTDQKIKVQLSQNLKHAAIDDATLSKYALTHQEDGEAVVSLRLPQKGEYALKLYAQGEGKPGEAPNVCNYLIRCTGVDGGGQPFPNFAEGFLGKSPMADKLGVKALSHTGAQIDAKDGKVSVKFNARNDVEMICEVHSNDPKALKKTAVATRNENGEWTFDVDMPKAGEYSLNVFARQKGNPNRIYNVHSYLVESTGKPGYNDEKIDDEIDGADLVIPTETVETSEDVVVIPVPPGCKRAVAAVHRRNANDPPSSDQIEFISQDDMNLVKVELKEYGEYMLNLYDIDENGVVKNVARYQVNRKRPGDLYNTNLKMIMETMNEEGGNTSNGRAPSLSPEDTEEDKQKRTEEEKKRHAMKQLQRAMDLKDERQLEAAIATYMDCNPAQGDELLAKARRLLEVLKIRGELMDASQKRDLPSLDRAIKRAKEMNSDHMLDLQIAMASRLQEHLQKIEKLRHAVLNMQQTTVSELRNYSNPPDGVHQTLMATFLLLGHSMKNLKVWRNVQALMGKTGKESMMRKVSNFKPKDIPLSVSRSAKKVLDPISKEHIRDVSAGAATFYVWSRGMIEEVESYGGAEANAAQNKLQYKE
ncbi:uncharacterized protein LOC124136163 isoform X2 [Haliotis rufescens]|uniref:uncharacterized protein LOC124136163 isoform X2 n=1 Tax=Haliotis rufescens TaxID=6454 RepID=UPI00201F095C|nr:uncharacterized protein LOC124136163 isoform X2 [Haliotis rufescens]